MIDLEKLQTGANTLLVMFLRGLAAILPVFLTIYLVIALLIWLESSIHDVLTLVLPESFYLPGMGIIGAFFSVIAVGYLIQLPVLNLPVRLGEAILERLPLVKSLYKAISDVADFLSSMRDPDKEDKGTPVMVEVTPDVKLIGFVTQSSPSIAGDDDRALVYMPLSYQVGGYTALIERSKLTPLEMGAEDAMRYVLTAGLNTTKK